MLDKMMNEWAELNFDLSEWRDTGIPILKGDNVEEIQLVLDEHAIKAQTVRANPNISIHEQRAKAWEKTMFKLQEILDVWIKVQANYLYLEPIFNSDDISKKLPGEAADFQRIDKMWKRLMKEVKEDTMVLQLDYKDGLLDELKQAAQVLDRI